MMRILAAVLFVAGCTVGDPNPAPGGGGGGGGGGGTQMGSGSGMPDAGGTALPACTGAVYDPCTGPAQCTSDMCQLFNGAGIQVCTQACTPGDNTTCPQQNGAPATCNNMGICKPNAANSCMR